MGTQLKAGVIGLGILGSQHAQFLDGHPEVEVTAVADVQSGKAQQVGGQVDAQPYTDFERMLQEQRFLHFVPMFW